MNRDEIIDIATRLEMPSYTRIDLVAARGEGARVFDVDGTSYLDLYGGHAVALLGHAPPVVAEAIAGQARDLLFYSNVVHLPARARATERLARLAPWPDARVFYVNSGTEANETALKIARQATGRRETVAFHGGFHGRTLGALAACGFESYRAPTEGLVTGVRFGEFNGDVAVIDETCAAVIVEPIQSMGGVKTMTAEFARALRQRCDDTGALLIFDEIQTAPARTGFWFAGERWNVTPDLITTAKGVAAGFPAGVVLARGGVAEVVRPGDQGTTFGGGPLACAAIDATIEELERIDAPALAAGIERRFRAGLEGHEVLGHGALLGVRIRDKEAVRRLREGHRVLAGGSPGDPTVLRLLPPLTLTDAEIDEGLAALRRVLA